MTFDAPLFRRLRSRAAGIGLAVLAGIGSSLVAHPSGAQSKPENRFDPRFPDDKWAYSELTEGRARVVVENNYLTDAPTRCSIELSFRADYANNEALRRQQTNPVAVLKRLEMGYELFGNPRTSNDLHAFLRMRFERVDSGAPLRVERIVFDYIYGNDRNKVAHPSTAHWNGEALDADGFGKISIPVAKMDRIELRDFNVKLGFYQVIVAVTLPELGEDRAYAIPKAATLDLDRSLMACTCAFRNARLNDRFVMNCAEPLLDPNSTR